MNSLIGLSILGNGRRSEYPLERCVVPVPRTHSVPQSNQTSTHTWDYVTGEERGKLLGYAYPEWIVYRDMALYWKMIMATSHLM